MAQEQKPAFNVGDVVQIVDTPYMACPFSWVDGMDEFCVRYVQIVSVIWSCVQSCYCYHIDADNGRFAWCENCFVADADLEESGCDVDILFHIK